MSTCFKLNVKLFARPSVMFNNIRSAGHFKRKLNLSVILPRVVSTAEFRNFNSSSRLNGDWRAQIVNSGRNLKITG